jgi:hypothetical protein
MPSNRLDPDLLERLAKHPKVRGKVSKAAIRSRLSEIRRDNPGVTLNAAAHVFAQRKGLSLFRNLEDEDKLSLRNMRTSVPQGEAKKREQKTKYHETYPSFGTEFVDDANKNASVYPFVYLLENSMRDIILRYFQDKPSWWNNPQFVHTDIQDYAAKIQQAEKKHAWLPNRGNHPIHYVGLDELYKIVERNWQMFKGVFRDQGNLRTWMNESVPIRNLIAHNIPVQAQERTNIEIRAKYICTLIDKAKRREK